MYDWAKLAKAVKDRREAMKLTQGQLAKRAGVGSSTIRNIEQQARESYSPTTLAAVEYALLAPQGWAESVLLGKQEATIPAVRVVDATVAAVMRQFTPAPGHIGDVTSLGDPEVFQRVMAAVGAATPPGGEQSAGGGVVNLAAESSLSADATAHPPSFSKLRALRPLFDAYSALTSIPDPTSAERIATEVVWGLIERVREEVESAHGDDPEPSETEESSVGTGSASSSLPRSGRVLTDPAMRAVRKTTTGTRHRIAKPGRVVSSHEGPAVQKAVDFLRADQGGRVRVLGVDGKVVREIDVKADASGG